MLISHYDLCAIQHIVDLAPKEAQWFHRLERIDAGSHTVYRIFGMYIPEQYCSGAEVESEPEMMMNFYKELRDENGQDEANEIMANLTVWCHSHHNMGVNPSGQDTKQFREQIDNAKEQNVDLPQVMIIFNKKNQYYCRIWDPENEIMYENVDLIIGNYDFKDLTEQTKTKFKKKPVKVFAPGRTYNTDRSGVIEWGYSDGLFSGTATKPSGKAKKKQAKQSYRAYQTVVKKPF